MTRRTMLVCLWLTLTALAVAAPAPLFRCMRHRPPVPIGLWKDANGNTAEFRKDGTYNGSGTLYPYEGTWRLVSYEQIVVTIDLSHGSKDPWSYTFFYLINDGELVSSNLTYRRVECSR